MYLLETTDLDIKKNDYADYKAVNKKTGGIVFPYTCCCQSLQPSFGGLTVSH